MNIIRGNIVDVINKRIFKGEIQYTDKIENIVELDDVVRFNILSKDYPL